MFFLFFHAGDKVLTGHGLVFHQVGDHLTKLLLIFLQNLGTVVKGLPDQGMDFIVNGASNLFRIPFYLLVITANEQLIAAGIGHSTQALAHAVPGDHIPGQLGGSVDIVGCAGGNIL